MFIWSIFAIIAVVGVLYEIDGQVTDCNPANSVVDVRMKTMNGRQCFFPFKYDNVTYDDCAGDVRKWCATTCNFERDYQFGICRWERRNLLEPSCQNLTDSQPQSIPETRKGQKCLFPFVYQNKCYNDCTKEGSDNLWCGTTSSVDLYASEFDNCWYKKEIIGTPDCASLSVAQKYRFPETTTGAMCVFPYINYGVCQVDCISENDGNMWCSTDKVYNGTNFAYCKFLFNVEQYGTILKHGLYIISANCFHSPLCGGIVVSSLNANNSMVLLAHNFSSYQINMWEVIPQPNSTVIIRVPLSQSGPSGLQPAWSISVSSLIILKTLDQYKNNIKFTLTDSGNKTGFILSKTVDNTVTASSMVGFQARSNDIRRFAPLEDVPIKLYWRFTLVQPLTKEDLKDTGITTTTASTTTGSTTTGSTTTGSTTTGSTTTGSTTTGSTTTGSTTTGSTTTGSTTTGSTTTGSTTTGSTTTGSTTTGSTTTGSTTTNSTITGSTRSGSQTNTRFSVTESTTKDTKPIPTLPVTSNTNESTDKLVEKINALQVIISVTLAVVAVDLIVTIISIVCLVRKV